MSWTGHRSRAIEVAPDRRKVVKDADHDGIRPRSDGNVHVDEMNAQSPDTRPRGHGGEGPESGTLGL